MLTDRDAGTIIPVRAEKEVRCPYCSKLLMKGELASGTRIQVKCHGSNCRRLLNIERM